MNINRTRFLVLLTVEPEKVTDVSDSIANSLSRKFGGVTIISGADASGYWVDEGYEFKEHYPGVVHKESLLVIILTVMPYDQERALTAIRSAAQKAVKDFSLSSRFLHIETSSSQSWHTDLDSWSD